MSQRRIRIHVVRRMICLKSAERDELAGNEANAWNDCSMLISFEPVGAPQLDELSELHAGRIPNVWRTPCAMMCLSRSDNITVERQGEESLQHAGRGFTAGSVLTPDFR